MKPPGPVALRAADEAEANVGVREQGGNNRGKFVEIYLRAVNLLRGNPWCLAFVVFRLTDAARDLGLEKTIPHTMPITGYTPTFVNWAKKMLLWTGAKWATNQSVERGDLLFFYKPFLRRIGHVGIVVKVERVSGVIHTVEGNTNYAGSREGDGVYRKSYKLSGLHQKSGFVRLPF